MLYYQLKLYTIIFEYQDLDFMDLLLGAVFMMIVGMSWSLDGYIMGKIPKLGIDAAVLIFFANVIAALACLGYIAVSVWRDGLPEFTSGSYLCLGMVLLSGMVNTFQLRLLSAAMQRGPNGIVWTVTQAGFIFPFLMGVIFFGELLGWMRIAGMVLIIIALVLFGISRNGHGSGNWKLLAGLAFIITGASQALCNLPSYFEAGSALPSSWRTLAASCGFAITAFGGSCWDKNFFSGIKFAVKVPKFWLYIGLCNIFSLFCSITLLYPGMDKLERAGAGSIAFPMMVCSCLLSFELFSIAVLKEKRSPLEIIALIFCLLGVIGISGVIGMSF